MPVELRDGYQRRSCGPPNRVRRTRPGLRQDRRGAPANPVTEDELRDVVSKYWVIERSVRPAFAAISATSTIRFPVKEIRDEGNGRKSCRPGCCPPTWAESAAAGGVTLLRVD